MQDSENESEDFIRELTKGSVLGCRGGGEVKSGEPR